VRGVGFDCGSISDGAVSRRSLVEVKFGGGAT
jgi:hypothetical protein